MVYMYMYFHVARWTPLNNIHLGDHLLDTVVTCSYGIPSVVPDTSREALFHTAAHCHLRGSTFQENVYFYVEIDGAQYTKDLYLFSIADVQAGVSQVSDNIWLPMPPNRMVYISTTVAFPSCAAGIDLIGYR